MKRFNFSGAASKAGRRYKLMPVFLLVLLTSMFSTVTLAAEMLVNGDFEQPDLSTFAKGSRADVEGWTTFFGQNFTGTCTIECNGDTLIPGWSVVWSDTWNDPVPTPGRIEVQANLLTVLYPGISTAKGGSQKVELDSHDRVSSLLHSGNHNVTLFQEFASCPNTAYTLTYNWRSRRAILGDNDVDVMVDGTVVRNHSMTANWVKETVSFVTDKTGSTGLAFASLGDGNTYGMSLDNISVIGPAANACPPPPGDCQDCKNDPTAVGCQCEGYTKPVVESASSTLSDFSGLGWSVVKKGSDVIECGLCFPAGGSDKHGKLTELTLLYDGNDYTSHGQGAFPDKFSIIPATVGTFPNLANIRVFKDDKGTAGTKLFEGEIEIGEIFKFVPDGSSVLIEIRPKNLSHVVQTIVFHVSCSKPLENQDSFGGITIWDGITVAK